MESISNSKTGNKTEESRSSLLRSVASSTAIETGQDIKEIEATLKAKNSKFQHLKLAS